MISDKAFERFPIINKFKNECIIILLCMVLGMFPFLSFAKQHSSGGSETVEYKTVEYIVFGILTLCFCGFLRSFLNQSKDEYSLYVETYKRTGNEFSASAYFWYRLDYLFSYSKSFKIYILATATIALITFGGLLWVIITNHSFAESVWVAWTYVADPGTHADNTGWLTRLVSFGLTLGGMVIFAMVIGIISEEIASFVENLKQGKCNVVESGHTLIIGQGDKLLPTIEQIAKANQSEGGGLIVVLTTLPKQEVEEFILRSQVNLYGTSKYKYIYIYKCVCVLY